MKKPIISDMPQGRAKTAVATAPMDVFGCELIVANRDGCARRQLGYPAPTNCSALERP